MILSSEISGKAPLEQEDYDLINLLEEAHYKSSYRGNMSTNAAVVSMAGSSSYIQAIASAILTLGGTHGPIKDAIKVLNGDDSVLVNDKIPGWGNSFEKGHPDPLWNNVHEFIFENYPEMGARIAQVTKRLHDSGKVIFPNPACYTAATAILLKINPKVCEYLFLAARLPAWTSILTKQ